MTEERKAPDSGAADDSRVSDLYRDVATERTPKHLDQAVLREAARAVRPRYWRLRLWTRPAAWAAIVLLSATLLLQVSQVQPPQDAVPRVLELEDRAAARELDEAEASAERQRNDVGSAAKATGTTVPRQEQPAAELLEAVADQDADLFTQAEEMARTRLGPDDAPATPAAASADAPQAAAPSCDASLRAAPESWMDCITRLEDAGFMAAADHERRLLNETFPDFDTR
jgi:hypothetical protein